MRRRDLLEGLATGSVAVTGVIGTGKIRRDMKEQSTLSEIQESVIYAEDQEDFREVDVETVLEEGIREPVVITDEVREIDPEGKPVPCSSEFYSNIYELGTEKRLHAFTGPDEFYTSTPPELSNGQNSFVGVFDVPCNYDVPKNSYRGGEVLVAEEFNRGDELEEI